MKRRTLWMMFLFLAIPIAISAQSVHPFFEKGDVVFKKELLGKWETEGPQVEFRDAGKGKYGIVLQLDQQMAWYFQAHLIHLGERYFLDGQVSSLDFPTPPAEGGWSWEKESEAERFNLKEDDIFLNRAHGLLLVSFSSNPDEFSLSVWDKNWLPDMAKERKLNVPYTKDDFGRILLLAESSAMRKFTRDLPKEAFDEAHTLRRAHQDGGKKKSVMENPSVHDTRRPRPSAPVISLDSSAQIDGPWRFHYTEQKAR